MQVKEGDLVWTKDSRRGVCRFIGNVRNSQEKESKTVYYGVEWLPEEASPAHQEHHNVGNSNDKTIVYDAPFETKFRGKSSFIKFKKLVEPISFSKALLERYEASAENKENAYVTKESVNYKIEAVGMEKIKRKQKINLLERAYIDYAGVNRFQGSKLIKLTELSLRGNLFSKFSEITHFCDNMPNLRHINASDNYFLEDDCNINSSYPNMKVLVLNTCFLMWNRIVAITEKFPNIEELFLSHNKLSDDLPELNLPKLEVLDLSFNKLTNFNALCAQFGGLPKLKRLSVGNNAYHSLELSATSVKNLKMLQHLALSNNPLNSTLEVLKLKPLVSMTELRLTMHGAKLQLEKLLVITNLPKLKFLNGSETYISDRGRRDQRKAFLFWIRETFLSNELNTYLQSYFNIEVTNEVEDIFLQIKSCFPEYEKIAKENEFNFLAFARDEESKHNASMPATKNIILVTFRSFASTSCEKKPKQVKLKTSFSIGQVKKLCEAWFKIPQNKQKLLLREQTANFTSIPSNESNNGNKYSVPVEIKAYNNETTLLDLFIPNNAEIIVQKV